MKQLVEKLRQVEQSLSDEKGRFTLFALFLPEEAPGGAWDLVVSAPWATAWAATIRVFAERLRATLSPDEFMRIAKVVVIEPNNPALSAVLDEADIEHGLVEVQNRTFFGVDIRRALFITCRREPSPQPA